MAPTFGRKPMMGTNPISVAAPAAAREPYVLDMATTTVAVGKLNIALAGRSPSRGMGLDERARRPPRTRAGVWPRACSPRSRGSRELGSHKAMAWAFSWTFSPGVLGGAVYGDVLDRKGLRAQKVTNTGHCFAAIDIKRFRPLEEFTADMDDMLGALQDMPTADGHERVYTAGQPEAETERHRRVTGHPHRAGPRPAVQRHRRVSRSKALDLISRGLAGSGRGSLVRSTSSPRAPPRSDASACPPSPEAGCARRPLRQDGSRGGGVLRSGARYGSSDSLPMAPPASPP